MEETPLPSLFREFLYTMGRGPPRSRDGRNGILPDRMTDVTGHEFEPLKLLRDKIVIVIVYKSTDCPVCPVLPQMLSFVSGNPVFDFVEERELHVTTYIDVLNGGRETKSLPEGIQKTANLVLFTDSTFIFLIPGLQQEVLAHAHIAGTTWKDARFVADSLDLPIIRRLAVSHNMILDGGRAVPAILEFEGTNSMIVYGRGPAAYGHFDLLRHLFRRRSTIESECQHSVVHANKLLSKTAEIGDQLLSSRNRQMAAFPNEILEQIVSYLPSSEISMEFAKVSISWYISVLASTRNHLRSEIQKAEELMCHLDGKTVVLDEQTAQYPEGTEIRAIPIRIIEKQQRKLMGWYEVLCQLVGLKI